MEKLNEQYWNNRYETNTAGWDIGFISTPLKEYFDQLSNKEIAILIPGSGNAYEAEYLLQKGFKNITVVDLSINAVNAIKKRLQHYDGKELNAIYGDFFDIELQFDLVIEQTFFCALDPALRQQYATKMHDVLVEKGKLVGVLFDREFEGGPPFGGSCNEYETLFAPLFDIKVLAPCINSIAPRAGTEVFIILQKSK